MLHNIVSKVVVNSSIPKFFVFSWLPTRVNLSRRGVLLDSHLCPLCNAAMEDVQHVFFRCDVTRVVLRKICRWWDLDWQEICSFSDWDAWFLSFRLSSRLKSILEAKEIASLKKRVKQLEKRKKSRTLRLKRLRKGRKIADLDADAEVKKLLLKRIAKKEVSAADPVTTAGEVVTANTTAVASMSPKAKGIVFHDREEQASSFTPIVSSSQLPQAKDKAELTSRVDKELESSILLKNWIDSSLCLKDDEQLAARLKLKNTNNSLLKKSQEYDDQEQAEMKRHIEIVKNDEVAIDAIPLATKPPMIVEYKIDKDGRMGYFKLIRADESSKRYSSMIKMLQDINREDLETLWKLVKAKHGNTRPEEDYERVLWGDLKVMFEPDIKSEIWRNYKDYKWTYLEVV
ncbi:putative reverse transcriptase, RNA-dependent DNA polymerase [Tanacetum coccineum]